MARIEWQCGYLLQEIFSNHTSSLNIPVNWKLISCSSLLFFWFPLGLKYMYNKYFFQSQSSYKNVEKTFCQWINKKVSIKEVIQSKWSRKCPQSIGQSMLRNGKWWVRTWDIVVWLSLEVRNNAIMVRIMIDDLYFSSIRWTVSCVVWEELSLFHWPFNFGWPDFLLWSKWPLTENKVCVIFFAAHSDQYTLYRPFLYPSSMCFSSLCYSTSCSTTLCLDFLPCQWTGLGNSHYLPTMLV